jgi:hypothetical protein
MPDIFVSLSGEATGEDSGKESCLHRWNRSPRTIRTRVFRVSRVLVIRILSSSAGERMSTLWMSLPSTVRQSPTAKCVGRGSDDLGRTTKALGCFFREKPFPARTVRSLPVGFRQRGVSFAVSGTRSRRIRMVRDPVHLWRWTTSPAITVSDWTPGRGFSSSGPPA